MFNALKRERLAEREERRLEKVQEKKDQEERNKEKVMAKLSLNVDGNSPGSPVRVSLQVKLFNPGPLTVPVKSVELHRQENPDVVTRIKFVTLVQFSMPIADAEAGSATVTLGSTDSVVIEERREATFTLPSYPLPMLKQISDSSADKVWVSVSSHAGEICRIDGEKVIPLLRELIRSQEMFAQRMSEEEPPPVPG